MPKLNQNFILYYNTSSHLNQQNNLIDLKFNLKTINNLIQ